MFSYMREMFAGYLIIRPNLSRLFDAVAEWEPTFVAGTIVAGRSRGRLFSRLKELDIPELLERLAPGQSIYLLGDRGTLAYLHLIKLDQDEVVVIDMSPSLIQFEFDRSCQTSDARLSEGTALHGLQIFVPFVLLSEEQLATLVSIVAQQIPPVRSVSGGNGLILPKTTITALRQFRSTPQRTILTITNGSKSLVWRIEDKIAIYAIGYTLMKVIEKM